MLEPVLRHRPCVGPVRAADLTCQGRPLVFLAPIDNADLNEIMSSLVGLEWAVMWQFRQTAGSCRHTSHVGRDFYYCCTPGSSSKLHYFLQG